jgi:2-methylisocitrate lyase-like PEP mutase family enzyme
VSVTCCPVEISQCIRVLFGRGILQSHQAQAIYMTGYWVVASYLGQPDAGLATCTDMVDCAEAIADAIHKPLIADADTG